MNGIKHQSSPVLLLAWIVFDSAFAVCTLPVFAGRLVFYLLLLGVVTVLSLEAVFELEHKLCLAGWRDPLVTMWRRARAGRRPRSSHLRTIAALGVTDEELRRYQQFADQIRSHYASVMDLDAEVELEFSHFRDDGTPMINGIRRL
ncbi:MAG: hypothetical protein CR217_15165 [Beijerinckiaceae bacterium]|nr:MAG: hypothetical protein CR217_15165 [Beijerinckiaceae bacterium]